MSTKSDDRLTDLYFKEVGEHELFTAAEEHRLFTAYRAAHSRADLAQSPYLQEKYRAEAVAIGKHLAHGYLRFVIREARKRSRDETLFKDLISEGNIGLMRGIEKFDPTREVRFLTYGSNWIQVFMQEHLQKIGLVHMPNHTRKALRKSRAEADKQRAKGETPVHEVQEPAVASIDNVVVAADDDVEQDLVRRRCDMLRHMEDAGLSRLEKFVLVYRYGLRDDGEERELDAVAQIIYELDGSQITQESVRLAEQAALGKLREHLEYAADAECASDLL